MNYETYSFFEGVSSDHRIVTAMIQLGLRRNKAQKTTTKHYDWSLITKRDIRDKYALTLRNKFDALQEKTETHTSNDEYENFVNAHLKAEAECIPTIQRAKPRVPWNTLADRKKCAYEKTASKSNRKNPANTNALKHKKAQREYIQNQINQIRDSVEYRQARIAWQTVNEVSRRKSTGKAKLKATSQQERIHPWKQHFKNLHGNPPKITHEPIKRIISKHLDIKLGQFTQKEFV